MGVLVVLHDVGSQSKVADFVRVVLAFREEVEGVVISRPSGGAAMYGVPEASKSLFRESIPLVVVSDLRDLGELFKGRRRVFVSPSKGREVSDFRELQAAGDVALVFSGGETGFSEKELGEADDVITLKGLRRELPPDALLAIYLYELSAARRRA